MIAPRNLPAGRRRILPAATLLVLLAAAGPARAQTTIDAAAGQDRYYRAERWIPLRITLTNQGSPARVEVRARFAVGGEGVHEYRIPARELRSGAAEIHTLYMKSPLSYNTQTLVLDLFRDGRLIQTLRPPVTLVNEGEWLVAGIGPGQSNLKLLTAESLPQTQTSPKARPWMRGNVPQPKIHVAVLDPSLSPDRWQGLDAVDLLVVGNLSERDFTPDQLQALRDFAIAGGHLVFTGGPNWQRLATPYFSELLPVQVTGARSVSELPLLGPFAGPSAPSGSPFTLCEARVKPGGEVIVPAGRFPAVATGRKGSGRVTFVAFDPALPPFSNWGGTVKFWRRLMVSEPPPAILSQVTVSDSWDANNGMGQGQPRLSDAPYAISQLDIPSFYIVALFLMAYIIVLVPVNYYFLKARDKKEYAWLTTPAIVAVFSLGAYAIGYGFKGGRSLIVRVGVMEAYTGQDSAPIVTYAGLFSPRKTGYDIQPGPPAGSGEGEDPTVLLSEPVAGRPSVGLRVLQDDTQKIEGFAVDMWAMRVVKTEGIARLGKGFTAAPGKQGLDGVIRNQSPFTLEDCTVYRGSQFAAVGSLPPGASARFQLDPGGTIQTGGGGLLPASLLTRVPGNRESERIRRAVLQPLCSYGSYSQAPGTWPHGEGILVGWVKEPVSRLRVNGRAPREQAAILMVVHLGPAR